MSNRSVHLGGRGGKRRSKRTGFAAAVLLCAIEPLETRTMLAAQLIKDINPGTTGITTPSSLVDVSGTVFFAADNKLWKTDGTDSGTAKVTDSVSGPSALTNVSGTLYFVANGALWKSDGSAGGTVQVSSASPNPKNLAVVNSTVFFRGTDSGGSELWKSDGTPAGTVRVKDINPGTAGSDPRGLVAVNGRLFFHASDGTSGEELWTSDGTANGTVRVKDINPGAGSSDPASLTNVNGTLFFAAHDADNTGYELWKSDGTDAGTVRVKDIRPGAGGSAPTSLRSFNGKLMFVAADGTNGYELWSSDGTAAGTVMVRDIVPGGGGAFIDNLSVVGGTMFFTADDGTSGQELWKTDGTTAGTVRVKDIASGTLGSDPGVLTAVGTRLFFTANAGPTGQELWTSDATDAGTFMVNEIGPGRAHAQANNLTASAGRLLFVASDASGPGIWKSDGTPGGTVLVKQINVYNPAGSGISMSIRIGSTIFFSANDGISGQELWKSDGTSLGTTMVVDLTPGAGGTNPQELTDVNGTLYFAGGGRLYKSDGTAVGTGLVTSASINPSKLTNVNGMLFFVGSDSSGAELWQSDGTSAGTTRLKDINPGGSSWPESLTNVNGTLMFLANDGASGLELWKSNGTTAGTVRVKDIITGSGSPGSALLTASNGMLFFRGTDGVNGYELWRSDGTDSGTIMLKDLRAGSGSSVIQSPVDVNGTLFFTADDGVHGQELYKSDGTPAGTVLVRDINAIGGHGSSPTNLINVNGTLFLRADDGVNGAELWKSDGTTAGTVLVKDLRAGAAGSGLLRFVNVDGTLLFTATDGTPFQMFKSDGTAAGTVSAGLPYDVSLPRTVTVLNGSIFFSSSNYLSGEELWKLPITAAAGATLASAPGPASAATQPFNSSPATEAATVAGKYSATAATADTTSAPSPRIASSAPDVFYDAMLRSDKPASLATFPLAGVVVDYGYTFTDWDQNYADETNVRQLANNAASLGQPLIFDIEHWQIDSRFNSEATVAISLEKLMQIVDWVHDERPGVKVGFYGILPMLQYPAAAPGSASYTTWHNATLRALPLIQKVDLLYPGLYTPSPDPNVWRNFCDGMLTEAVSFGKPVLPFYWMRYFFDPNGNADFRYLSPDFCRMELEMARDLGDGAVLWDDVPPWVDDMPWWTVTKDFLLNSDAMASAAPTNLSATALSTSRIDLAWSDNAFNETGFRVERRADAGAFAAVTTVGRNVTSYSDIGLSASTNYTYRVVAVNAGGDSLASNEVAARTADAVFPPTPPTQPSAAALSTRRIQFAWTDTSNNEQGFLIERAVGGGGFTQVGSVPDDITIFIDTGLTPGTTYSYRVRAFNAIGNSAYSSTVSATTLLSTGGMRGQWRLDEGTGSTTADASGAAHSGTLAGGPVWTAGKLGGALSFDGVDDRVRLADASDLRFTQTQSFTLSSWVDLSTLPNKKSGIVTKSRAASPWYGIWLDATNHWVFGGAAGDIVGSVASTGWALVTAVQDGAAATRRLYVNGALVASGAAQASDGSGELWIGGAEGVSEFFAGAIDDVRLYGRALAADEVQALANPRVTLAGSAGDDTWTVRLDPAGGAYLFDNGVTSFTEPLDAIAAIDFAGGAGNDTLLLDLSDGDVVPPYGVNFDGGAATDTLEIRGAAALDAFQVDAAQVSHSSIPIAFASIESLALSSSTFTFVTDAAGKNVTASDHAALVFPLSQHLSALSLSGQAEAAFTAGAQKVLVLNSLAISSDSTLDLSAGAMVLHSTAAVRAGDYASVLGYLHSSMYGVNGPWTGAGLTSSTAAANTDLDFALGVLLNDQQALDPNFSSAALYSTFAGENADVNSILVTFTWFGDADLNGRVDITDYFLIDHGFSSHLSGWVNGDFDATGHVDSTDYFLIDHAFNSQTAPFQTIWLPARRPDDQTLFP